MTNGEKKLNRKKIEQHSQQLIAVVCDFLDSKSLNLENGFSVLYITFIKMACYAGNHDKEELHKLLEILKNDINYICQKI